MKKEVAIFIANNYADYEISFIGPELNSRAEDYKLVYVAPTKDTIISMGGLKVTPDFSINEYIEKNEKSYGIDLLILCGGKIWIESKYILPRVKNLVDLCKENGTMIAAICDATTFLANNGYLDDIKHSGNSVEYIEMNCPAYKGHENYIEEQAVNDGGFITGNGTSTLEFAKEIMLYLSLMPSEKIENWYLFHKKGAYPK